MSKCINCIYYSVYNDYKFKPLPICSRFSNLIEASEVVKSENCEFKRTIPISLNETINNATKGIEDMTKNIKALKEGLENVR